MAEEPSPPSPELTEQQRQRVEANRQRAMAKRKALMSQNQQQNQDESNPYWRQFKCRKLTILPKQDPPPLQHRFRVSLEICSPDSFSIVPQPLQGFLFPGQDHCFRVLEDWLSNVRITHYTQINGGGEASVYKLREYDAVLRCLKNYKDIEVEEIPWTTYNVVEKLSHSYITGRWIPCRPEHLPDEKVEELIQKLPRKLSSILLPFQLDGLKFGLRRGGRCLIADEMGLGKTLQAIAIASCFSHEGSILVVCPAILRYSWAEELERWLPSYLPADIHLVFGRQNNPVHLKRCPKIVVISYTMLHRLRESMLQLEWGVLVIDESHHVRCSKKKSEPRETRAVLDVASKAKRIVLLSGTPSLSRPGLLGKDKFDFAKTYCSMKVVTDPQGKTFMDFSKGTRLEELNVLLRQTVMIRRLKEHLLVQLPPKRRQIIKMCLKKSDIAFAKNVVAAEGESFATNCTGEEDDEKDDGEGDTQEKLSAQVLGIAKVSGFLEWLSLHPIATEGQDTSNVEVNASSHKMIIFAHHLKVLDKLQEFICGKGIGFVRIDGNVLDSDRQSAVKSFQSSQEVKIAIFGLQVGYAGLDLSVAHNVVFLELPKNPNTLQQAEDRAHRRGQTNAVNIYIFCAKDTSDESRWRRLNSSLQRVSSTIDGKYDAVREIAVDNISNLEDKNFCQNVNLDNAAPAPEENPADDSVQNSVADLDNAAPAPGENPADDSVQNSVADLDNATPAPGENPADDSVQNSEADLDNIAPAPEENPADDNLQNSATDCGIDNKAAEKFEMTQKSIRDKSHELTEPWSSIQVNIHSLRFAVSQYTGRIHLCACSQGDDETLKSLSENFRPEDISASPSEGASDFIKENSALEFAIVSFINEWKTLSCIDKKKLFGRPLQLPLAVELLRDSKSGNHDSNGLLKGGSKRRHTPLCDISYPLSSNAVVKEVFVCYGSRKKDPYMQFWTLMDEPLCKLCQNPCLGVNAKKPKDFLDLFCSLACYEEYRSRTSGSFLRQELFEIERGICSNCQLDCHKLVQYLKPLTKENREKYIEREASQLTKHKKLMEKLVREPTEGNAWHADHKIAVFLGGGECKVDNMRTLCVACHADVTAAQNTERCLARKKLRKAMADLRSGRKRRAKMKDQGSLTLEEKADDDDDLLISVPGSKYSEPKQDDSIIKPIESFSMQ